MEKFNLKRTKQCAKCPWKTSTNPLDIPDGYSKELHKGLSCTIAKEGDIRGSKTAMACHHSNGGDQMYCIGWLNHQLGIGNNIGLRLRMMSCGNIKDIKVYGRQHVRFEDTLPE